LTPPRTQHAARAPGAAPSPPAAYGIPYDMCRVLI